MRTCVLIFAAVCVRETEKAFRHVSKFDKLKNELKMKCRPKKKKKKLV